MGHKIFYVLQASDMFWPCQMICPVIIWHIKSIIYMYIKYWHTTLWAFYYMMPAHLVATWLAWQGRSPSRCGRQCGRWWRVWWCSRCGRWTGWRSGLNRRGLAHSTHAWRPAEPGQMLLPQSSESSGWPGRQSILWSSLTSQTEVPRWGVHHQGSD